MTAPLPPYEVLWPSMRKEQQQKLFQAIDAVDLPAVEGILKKYKEAAGWKNDDGVPVIVAATLTGNADLALLILKVAPDVIDAGNANDSSAVMFAALAGDMALLRLLDHMNADLEHCNANGTNALMSAAHKGQREAVKFLSDAGVDLGRKDDHGRTAADHAREGGDEVLAQAIEAKEAEQRQVRFDFFRAIDAGDESAVAEILAQHKSAARWRDSNGLTGLMRAAQAGQEVIAEKLIEAAPDKIDAITSNGSTAFLFAAFSGHIGVMQKLDAGGADTRHKNRENRNALILSTAAKQVDAVQWLIDLPPEKRTNPTDVDSQGLAAIDYSNLDKTIQP